MENKQFLENYEQYDYICAPVEAKATQISLFDLFNGVVNAVEAETAYSVGVPSIEHAPLTFEAKRTAELINNYDEFINAPTFDLNIFGVLKLDMENFWAALQRNAATRARRGENNSARIRNKATTAGGSSIYEFGSGKRVFGYLLNNMTFDGQYAYVLTTKGLNAAARKPFKATAKYPKSNDQIRNAPTRWGKITSKLEALGVTATGAWAVLEEADSRFFYGEMKKHNWLNESDKQLLKAVRRAAGGLTFDLYVESLKQRTDEIEAKIKLLQVDNDAEYGFLEYLRSRLSIEEFNESPSVSDSLSLIQENNLKIIDLQAELAEIEAKLIASEEEDNTMAAETELADYDVWNYYVDGGY